MAAKVPTVIDSSTQLGTYVPSAAARCGVASGGTTIKKRSSHMPTMTVALLIAIVGMLRSLEIPSKMNGTTKLQATMVQNSMPYRPCSRTASTRISPGWLPYQVVKCSENVK